MKTNHSFRKSTRLVSLLLALMLAFSILPVSAFAASDIHIEVIRDNAPLRRENHDEGEIVARFPVGTLLSSTGSGLNWKLNKWYEVQYEGETCYIYSGNVEESNHIYQELYYNDVTYNICDCGYIKVSSYDTEKKTEGTEIAAMASLALPAAAADGPLPVGDVLAAGLLVVGVCMAHDVSVPSTKELGEMITETEFLDHINERENICSEYSFHRVARAEGKLICLDDRCLDRLEAYIYVNFLGGDVYTMNEDSALLLASMFGAAIMERDKDMSTYFFHYHPGEAKTKKAPHIFFGVNDLGEYPVGL